MHFIYICHSVIHLQLLVYLHCMINCQFICTLLHTALWACSTHGNTLSKFYSYFPLYLNCIGLLDMLSSYCKKLKKMLCYIASHTLFTLPVNFCLHILWFFKMFLTQQSFQLLFLLWQTYWYFFFMRDLCFFVPFLLFSLFHTHIHPREMMTWLRVTIIYFPLSTSLDLRACQLRLVSAVF